MVNDMELEFWIYMGICSLAGAVFWYLCYRGSARARIRIAEKKGRKPKLAHVRIFYIVTGIIGQVMFWDMVLTLSEWEGMR